MDHECKKEEIISEIRKNIDNLFDTKTIVTELKVLVSMLIDQSKKQDDILKRQSDTMIKISDTVEQQGILLTQLAAQQIDMLKKGSIEYLTIFQMILFKALPPIAVGGITYWILQVIGK